VQVAAIAFQTVAIQHSILGLLLVAVLAMLVSRGLVQAVLAAEETKMILVVLEL
jgi:hypothetical protein